MMVVERKRVGLEERRRQLKQPAISPSPSGTHTLDPGPIPVNSRIFALDRSVVQG